MSGRHAADVAPDAPRTAEHTRLAESPNSTSPWRLWGPYLAGRQWGTVREDYSADGDAWNYLPFEQSHARAYRWGEDGLGGICDRFGFLNVGLALWNGRDPVLKERLFGLTNGEGNHGEDVKEYWWPLDGTPTHSWMQWLYRYPQAEFPYARLREENARRSREDREYELADTGVLADDRFFDVTITYAKAAPDDVAIVIEATNHGPDPAPLHLLPQIWFRNTWAWGRDDRRASLQRLVPPELGAGALQAVECEHAFLGRYTLTAEGDPGVLVCDNETNAVALFGAEHNPTEFTKDGIGRRVVHGDESAVNPAGTGTKAAFWYVFDPVPPGETVRVQLRLSTAEPDENTFGPGFAAVLADRGGESDEFYSAVLPAQLTEEDKNIARRAFAGLLWSKQLYRWTVSEWLAGDPTQPAPPPDRVAGRDTSWQHLALADVFCMPDEWEYPWFAAWDLAFHCVALAHIDAASAKEQLLLLCREWAMHPDGQLPAYEWALGDVNPPVHVWAAWQVYVIDGRSDPDFLARVFAKLLMNFGWWVNRKDADGSNLFEGGFLGMDNIGLFDRSAQLPPGWRLEEADATSWMGAYCLHMLRIAVELASLHATWDIMATKFFEHFLGIAAAMSNFGSGNVQLWDEDDGFCYDVLVGPDGSTQRLAVRSMVGLLPLLAVGYARQGAADALPDYTSRVRWLQRRRPELLSGVLIGQRDPDAAGESAPVLLALLQPERAVRVVARMFDPEEFLSAYGIRSLSRAYTTPYVADVEGQTDTIDYEPGESRTALFGGNSNWRGPIWLPTNVLLADALRNYALFVGDATTIDSAGRQLTFAQAADEIDDRLVALFRTGPDGRRPCDGERIEASDNPLWHAHLTFSEYFHGDTGEGLGATHQTGWTALVAHVLCTRT